MPAAVETMMSVREVPWHRLGTVLDDYVKIAEAQKAAGLDWTVSLRPVYYETDDGEMVEHEKARLTWRDSDGTPFAVVGKDYSLIQNDEMFGFIEALLDVGDVKIETAGSLYGGRVVWALAKLDREVTVAGDETVPYLLASNSHAGWSAFTVHTTPVRVVCANTLQFAYKNHKSKWSIRHVGDPVQKLDEARKTLELSFEYYDEFEAEVQQLIDTEVTRQKFTSIVNRIIPTGETERSETLRATQRDQIKDLYENNPRNDFHGSGWGVINAVSEWELWRPTKSPSGIDEVQARKVYRGDATPLTLQARSMLVGRN